MGTADRWLDEHDRGFSPTGAVICQEHVVDDYLRSKASSPPEDEPCLLCSREDNPQLSLDGIAEIVMDAVTDSYTDPAELLLWDGREGGYQGPVMDTAEVLYAVCEGAFDGAYLEDLVDHLNDAIQAEAWTPWDESHPDVPSDVAELMWESFAHAVSNKHRFVFPSKSDKLKDGAQRDVSTFLDGVSVYCSSSMDLVRTTAPGLRVFRGRLVEKPGDFVASAENLGPAPAGRAAANRMSAAGISLLYASEDPETALAEIAGHGVEPYAVIGAFESTRELRILDLTGRPKFPSFFDPSQREQWMMAAFFSSFVKKVTRPVIPDARQHVEYAPTQVLTEYFRWASDPEIDGIALPSVQTGRKTYVFFVDRLEVAAGGPLGKSRFRFLPGDTATYEVIRRYTAKPIRS